MALRARFEKLDATPRWGVVRIRLDGFDTLRSAVGRTATNLAGTSSDRKSNKKQGIPVDVLLFIYTIFPSGLMVTMAKGMFLPLF